MSRIMGIDASGSCTGVAIYDTVLKDYIVVDKIRTAFRKATPTNAKRREKICTELSHMMLLNLVDIVIIEDIYVNKVSSAIPLAALRGAIEQTVLELDYEGLHVIESSKVKKAVTGKGNASKEDVYNTVKVLYKDCPLVVEALGDKLISQDNAQKNEDMSDAIALIHAYLSNPELAYIA